MMLLLWPKCRRQGAADAATLACCMAVLCVDAWDATTATRRPCRSWWTPRRATAPSAVSADSACGGVHHVGVIAGRGAALFIR